MTAVGMFGMQFLVNQKFARHTGGGARAALRFQLGCNLSGLAVLAAVIFSAPDASRPAASALSP